MSETATDTQSKPASTPRESSDQHALAQVEKWMAMIKEISHERQGPPKLRS
jgi:hypothetical protein